MRPERRPTASRASPVGGAAPGWGAAAGGGRGWGGGGRPRYGGGECGGVKPMFRLSKGTVSRAGLPRSVEGGLRRLVRLVTAGSGRLHAGGVHAVAPDRAAELQERLARLAGGSAEIFICPFSSAMGAH